MTRDFLRLLAILLAALQVGANLLNANECQYELVESMPDGLEPAPLPGVPIRATHESLIEMVRQAKQTIRIASFYLMLTPEEEIEHPSTKPGKMLLDELVAAAKRGVDVEIVVDNSNTRQMSNPKDISALEEAGARLKQLNMRQLLGAGVMHSKFLIADGQTLYVGSSNFDWRSYTQIKEIGVAYKNCPVLAKDLELIYRTYAEMSQQESLAGPLFAQDSFNALTNLSHPLNVDDIKVSLSGSPPAFNLHTGRTEDIDGLLRIIETAKWRIDISVMNYSPQREYARIREYWPVIDTALRRAATERNIRVRLLISKWSNSKPLEEVWYRSLNAIHSPFLRGGIHVKLFQVPALNEFQGSLPYARVKHDKFMVTDNGLYIGTSNWAPDYFTNTCGVGVVMESNKAPGERGAPKIVWTMQRLFDRDFNSQYAHDLHEVL